MTALEIAIVVIGVSAPVLFIAAALKYVERRPKLSAWLRSYFINLIVVWFATWFLGALALQAVGAAPFSLTWLGVSVPVAGLVWLLLVQVVTSSAAARFARTASPVVANVRRQVGATGRSIERWCKAHPLLAWSAGAIGAVSLGGTTYESTATTSANATSLGLLILGTGVLAGTFTGAQDLLLTSSLKKDLVIGQLNDDDDDVDDDDATGVESHVVIVKRDINGWIEGRDLRRTIHSGEAILFLALALTLGVVILALLLTVFVLAGWVAPAVEVNYGFHETWTLWTTGIVTGYWGLVVIVLAPGHALVHWFRSRRMIEQQQLEALQSIARAGKGPQRPGASASSKTMHELE